MLQQEPCELARTLKAEWGSVITVMEGLAIESPEALRSLLPAAQASRKR